MENTNNKHTEEKNGSSHSSDDGNNSMGSWIQWLFHEDSTDDLVEAAVQCSDGEGVISDNDGEDHDLITRFTDENSETNERLPETDYKTIGPVYWPLINPNLQQSTTSINRQVDDIPLEEEEPHVTFSSHVAIVSQDDVTFEELRDEYHGDMRSPSQITGDNDSEGSFLALPEAQKFYTVRSISSTSIASDKDFELTYDKVISINMPMDSNKKPDIIASLNDLSIKIKEMINLLTSLRERLAVAVSESHSDVSAQSTSERLPCMDGPTIQELDSTSLATNGASADDSAIEKVENKDCNNADVWSEDEC